MAWAKIKSENKQQTQHITNTHAPAMAVDKTYIVIVKIIMTYMYDGDAPAHVCNKRKQTLHNNTERYEIIQTHHTTTNKQITNPTHTNTPTINQNAHTIPTTYQQHTYIILITCTQNTNKLHTQLPT